MPGTPSSQFKAWAIPAQAAPIFDHTYVTSSCGYQWGCFGRDSGGTTPVQQGIGDSNVAECLSKPRNNGRLYAGLTYLVDGVCHQASNRSALKKAIGLCARRFRHCAEAQISPYRAQIRADLMAATASFRPHLPIWTQFSRLDGLTLPGAEPAPVSYSSHRRRIADDNCCARARDNEPAPCHTNFSSSRWPARRRSAHLKPSC